MLAANLLNDLLSVILPPRCHICGQLLPSTRRFLCAGCLAELPKANYRPENNPMTEALMLLPQGLDATAFLNYGVGNSTSVLIHDFKYRGFSRLARELGKEAATALRPSGFFNEVDKILPVPLHWMKLRRRGYNQAHEIAAGISEITGIPVGDNLKAVKSHATQTKLAKAARQENVRGVFGVKKRERVEGCTILIVDDVFTTGATLLSAASAVAESCRGVKIKLFALASACH